MRTKKRISIQGSSDKKKLRYIGYFHGYKGYRYHRNPSKIFNYSSFNELQAVYDFDMSLKAMLYPKIMFLETTTKNYALETVLEKSNSKRFADIYAKLLTMMLYTLKDLRNTVAHNNTVFDNRFHTSAINTRIGKYLETETGVRNITFYCIVDYIILVAYLMHALKCPRKDILSLIKSFESACETLYKSVSMPIYSSIVFTDTRNKLNQLKTFI